MNLPLNIASILSIGLMIGVEFAVWAYINPILRQLTDQARAQAIVLFARKLGKVMPFWYAFNLLLLIAEWILFRHAPGGSSIAAATGLWTLVIVLTHIFLVPINNRMALEQAHALADQAHREHHRWDVMHRARVVTLLAAFVLLLIAVGA